MVTGATPECSSAMLQAATLPGSQRNIPSLDGIRAISIILVLLAHSSWMFPAWFAGSQPFRMVIGNGMHGVAVFFVISGYLITSLLLRELDRTHTISLAHFYFRRTLRISPPYYVFLAIMGLLWAFHRVHLDRISFLSAVTYTWAVDPYAGAPLLTHCWSLSIEELFYLLWPLFLLFLHRRRQALSCTIGLIIFFPLLRVGLYFLTPVLRGHEFYMVQGWSDTMLFGCLLALLRKRPRFEAWQTRNLKIWMALGCAALGFYLSPWLIATLPKPWNGLYVLALNPTIIAASVACIVLYLITRTETLVARLLNGRAIRHLGVLSYSLYLWQQVFLSHPLDLRFWGYLLAFAAAEASFWLVERPSMRLRSSLENRFLSISRT